MLSMVWRKPSIFEWETFLSLSLFVLPVLGISDVEASRQRLDSVYVGQLSASWVDADQGECAERLLGVLDNSTLTFGPTHDSVDSNPYFISLMSPETSDLAVSMQSSISSRQLVETWWEVGAKLESSEGNYLVSGTLKNDTNLDKNSFLGSFGKTDSDWCGLKVQTFIWTYKVDTSTFSGTVSATEAVFSIDGSMLDKDTNRLISYVIQFSGNWDSRSAKLSFDKPTPTWPKPGRLDDANAEQSESSIFVDDDPISTTNPGDDTTTNPDNPPRSGGLGSGGVVGITTAGVFVLGFIIVAVFCVIHRRKRQKDGKAYPEVAYIYTPSPGVSGDSPQGYSKIMAHYNKYHGSDLEMRQVLVNDHSLPVTDQHQWRAF